MLLALGIFQVHSAGSSEELVMASGGAVAWTSRILLIRTNLNGRHIVYFLNLLYVSIQGLTAITAVSLYISKDTLYIKMLVMRPHKRWRQISQECNIIDNGV